MKIVLKRKRIAKLGIYYWRNKWKNHPWLSEIQRKSQRKKRRLSAFAVIVRKKKFINSVYGNSKDLKIVNERRLDVICFRSKFFCSIKAAQQGIRHGFVALNKNICYSPSQFLKSGDIVQISEKKLNCFVFQNEIKRNLRIIHQMNPCHILIDYKTLSFIFLFSPSYLVFPRGLLYSFRLFFKAISNKSNKY